MKTLKEKIPFVFLIMFMFAISTLCACGIFSVTTFALSLNEISTNTISATFTFNGSTQNSNPTFIADYNANDYSLEISGVSDVNSYEWYYAENNDYVQLTGQNTNVIKIRNCNQSGFYVCKITTSSGFGVTEPVSITINPKVVTFTKFTAQNKVYDGTTDINISAEYSGIVEGDDVEIFIIGKTSSPNADVNKLVTVTTNNIIFSSSNGCNYVANDNLPTELLFADITKKPVTFVWETLDNKLAYDYNGLDQINNISVYYYGINDVKTYLSFTISGYNGNINFYNEFKNAGNYTATAITTSREVNFEITNLTKRLDIKKVNPEVTINNKSFVYNGKEQDARDRVSINNTEQVLNFSNNKFTTVAEGNNREVTVSASESINYLGFSKKFKITVIKGTANIDVTNVKKNYTYTGSKQVINAGATIDNNEQTLNYYQNFFTTVAEGNNLEVGVFADATDNYNHVSTTFTINVEKATIDTSLWKWNYVNPYIYSVGTERVLRVNNYPENIVVATYKNERATNVGVYEASVVFTPIDSENYNPIPSFPNILWRINKQTVTIPVLNNITTTYNGKTQTLSNLSSNLLYTVVGNEQTNAGSYPVTISLREPNNFEWDNGTSNNLVINWIIQKAIVSKPEFNLDDFDGTAESIGILESDPYELIYSDDKFILLGLKDGENFTWKDTTRPYLRIDRAGGFFDGPALPIFVISLTLITLVLIAVYFAVHSTIIIKRHHRKVVLIKARKLKRQLVPVASGSLPSNANFTIEKEEVQEEQQSKDNVEETKDLIEQNSNQKTNIVINDNKADNKEKALSNNNEDKELVKQVADSETNKTSIVSKPRATRKSTAKKDTGEKTRKPYAKSRKKESKKKVAQKKKEINAKKVAIKKEAEKKKLATKKAKETAKKQASKTATKKSTKKVPAKSSTTKKTVSNKTDES